MEIGLRSPTRQTTPTPSSPGDYRTANPVYSTNSTTSRGCHLYLLSLLDPADRPGNKQDAIIIDFFPCPQALRFDVFAFYSVTSGAATGGFCKILQARVLWVGRGDREFEGQVRSVPEWPQEAQKLESAGLKSHLGIGVHRTRLSVERPQKAQKRDWARLEPFFVTFLLFVVEPFATFAGQRELSREKPGKRSLEGQVRSLLFHGDARFRILQRAHWIGRQS